MQLVTSFICKDFHLVSANKTVNQPKNRCPTIVPVESSRVHLTPKPGEDGSDYINASWLQGFHSLREFIVTQHPFKNTINDFWQMIWDHSSPLIVMIGIIDNAEYEVFWPVGEEVIKTTNFTINLTSENADSTFRLREFVMKSIQDDFEIPIKMLECNDWPNQITSITEIYQLPNCVLDLQLPTGPIVVVDRYVHIYFVLHVYHFRSFIICLFLFCPYNFLSLLLPLSICCPCCNINVSS